MQTFRTNIADNLRVARNFSSLQPEMRLSSQLVVRPECNIARNAIFFGFVTENVRNFVNFALISQNNSLRVMGEGGGRP